MRWERSRAANRNFPTAGPLRLSRGNGRSWPTCPYRRPNQRPERTSVLPAYPAVSAWCSRPVRAERRARRRGLCQYPPPPPPPPPPDPLDPWFSHIFDAVLLLPAVVVVVGEQAARPTAHANVRITAYIALVMRCLPLFDGASSRQTRCGGAYSTFHEGHRALRSLP
jgi:hypothetical protein